MRRLILLLLMFPAWPLAAFSPVLNQIVPRGAQRGTEQELHFYGDRLEGIQEALCYQPGVSFRDWKVIDGKHLSAIATIVLFPLWGYHIHFTDALGISLAFTVLSLARSYALRRAFNP